MRILIEGGEVVVSTGRLDTMLADVAVAVHPEDEKYAHLHHLQTVLEHPITGRKLKLVKDPEVRRVTRRKRYSSLSVLKLMELH